MTILAFSKEQGQIVLLPQRNNGSLLSVFLELVHFVTGLVVNQHDAHDESFP